MVSLDALKVVTDPSTQKPYRQQSKLADMQIVFIKGDAGLDEGLYGW